MPRKTVVIDYHACQPKTCKDGVCRAVAVCEKKLIKQREPYDLPEVKAATLCLSCGDCVAACQEEAIRII